MTILEAPFTSVADVAQKRYWIFPAKYLVLDNFDILATLDTARKRDNISQQIEEYRIIPL